MYVFEKNTEEKINGGCYKSDYKKSTESGAMRDKDTSREGV